MTKVFGLLFLAVVVVFSARTACAQTTEFTYQGSLRDGAATANGNYDFEFALFDALSAGNQIGTTIPKNNVAVANGIFSIKLDFGSVYPGADRYLEIRVRLAGQPGITTLAPRQLVNSAPYSVKSLNTDTATNATQLGGFASNQYVLTTDPRMNDPRPPTAGSANYIQNSTTQQAASDFNISGNGSAARLFGGVVGASRFEIFGQHALSMGDISGGTNSISAGSGAGSPLAGNFNAFFGNNAGAANAGGFGNSFFGKGAGQNITNQNNNSFFGNNSGSNASGSNNIFLGTLTGVASIGSDNTFVGNAAGNNVAASNNNTLLGSLTDAASNLTFATALGAGAFVSTSNTIALGRSNGADTVVIPGALNVTGTLSANLPSGSANYIQNQNTAPQTSSNFNISGTGSADVFNAAQQYNIGGTRILSKTGAANLFAGVSAGGVNTTGGNNAFFGANSGLFNSTGSSNTFVGRSSGNFNSTGSNNAFFGTDAGLDNQSGSLNSAFGSHTDVGSNLTNVTAIGANAQAGASNSLVLGSINGINNATASTNVGIGTTTPSERLEVVGNGLFSGNVTLGTPEATNLAGKLSIFNFAGVNVVLRDTVNDVEGFFGLNSGSGVFVGSSTSSNFGIRTNNSTRMTFDTVGNVGIGDSTPSDVLDVNGDIRTGTSGTNGCLKNNNGGAIIGTCSSDARFKRDFVPFDSVLNQLTRLQPKHFYWRAGDFPGRGFGSEREAGLVAQEVEQVLPELVTTDEQGFKAVNYSKLPLLTIQALKEQQQQIEAQQKQIEALTSALCSLKPDLDVCKKKN